MLSTQSLTSLRAGWWCVCQRSVHALHRRCCAASWAEHVLRNRGLPPESKDICGGGAHISLAGMCGGLSLTSQLLGQSLGRDHRLLLGPGTLGSGASSVGTGRLSRQHRPTHTHCCCFAQQHTRVLAGRRRPRATRRRSERRLQGKALDECTAHSAIPDTLRTICMITCTMTSALALQSTRAILHPIRRSIMTRAALLSQG